MVKAEWSHQIIWISILKNAADRSLLLVLLAGLVGCKPADPIQYQISLLKDTDSNVRYSAVDALVKLGKITEKPLIECLRNSDVNVRSSAAEALGKLSDMRAVGPLIACLKDKEWEVRMWAAGALGSLGDVQAVEPLIACLKAVGYRDDDCRDSVVRALGELGDARAVEPLLACLKNRQFESDSSVAYALGKLGKASLGPLIACLKDSKDDVRKPAASALVELGGISVEPLIACMKDKDENVQKAAADALADLGKISVDSLISCLKDKDENVQRSAADALGRIGDVRAVGPLIACLKATPLFGAETSISQESIAKALGSIGDKDAVVGLVEVLPADYTDFEIGAALKKLGWQPKSNTEKVFFWISVDDRESLMTNWETTKQVLLADLQSADIYKRLNAAHAFAGLKRDDIVPKLIDTLNSHGDGREAEIYLREGSWVLRDEAKDWLESHGYKVYVVKEP